MPVQRVFVIWTNALFLDTIRFILRHPNVELVGAASRQAASHSQIAALQPNVVIMEEDEPEDAANAETMSILRTGASVIHIGWSNNQVSIFQRRDRLAVKAEDLLGLILELDGGRQP